MERKVKGPYVWVSLAIIYINIYFPSRQLSFRITVMRGRVLNYMTLTQ